MDSQYDEYLKQEEQRKQIQDLVQSRDYFKKKYIETLSLLVPYSTRPKDVEALSQSIAQLNKKIHHLREELKKLQQQNQCLTEQMQTERTQHQNQIKQINMVLKSVLAKGE